MIVLREELPDGTLQRVIFRADADEDQATFKAAVKTWETANGIVADWEEFFDYCELMEAGRVVLEAPPA